MMMMMMMMVDDDDGWLMMSDRWLMTDDRWPMIAKWFHGQVSANLMADTSTSTSTLQNTCCDCKLQLILQAAVHKMYLGLPMQKAVDVLRLLHQLVPDVLEHEHCFSEVCFHPCCYQYSGKSTSGFWFSVGTHLRFKSICTPNLDEISQSMAEILLLPV